MKYWKSPEIRKSIKNFIFSTKIGFLGRFVIIFLIPLIFTWIMFDPFAVLSLKVNTNEPQSLHRSQINKDLTSSVFAEFFQTSLQLGWYKLCFENRGALEVGGQTVMGDEGSGNVSLQVREVLPSPYVAQYVTLDARPFEDIDCMRIGSGTEGISVGTSTISMGSLINDHAVMLNDNEFKIDFGFHFTNLNLYIKQDWTAFLVKYLVMVVLWASFILLIRNIWSFLNSTRYNK